MLLKVHVLRELKKKSTGDNFYLFGQTWVFRKIIFSIYMILSHARTTDRRRRRTHHHRRLRYY